LERERPGLLIGSDPYIQPWIVTPDIFVPGTVWTAKKRIKMLNVKVDILVIDPPFGLEYNRRREYNLLLGSPELIIDEAFKAAIELGIKNIILHYNKVVEKEHFRIIDGFIFKAYCRYLNANPKSYTILYSQY